MKLLALTIGGTPIPLPGPIQHINSTAGILGAHLIRNGISLLLYSSIILTLLFFLMGGVKWLTSQGDKKQLEDARKTITFALVGLLVAFLSFFVINLLGYFFKVPLIGQ